MTDTNILLIDKPVGITSFDVIRRLRKKLNIKKMGHAGTLDPLASGLMIIGVNEGTKRLNEYLKLDKEYVTDVLLGKRTKTGDLEGEVVAEQEVGVVTEEEVIDSLSSMVGTLTLPVSAYSAIKQSGVPLYKKARALEKSGQAIDFELPMREMKVYEAELLDMSDKMIRIRFKVGSGTYIRSLGEELGRLLGYPATLASLRRTKVGEFRVEEAEIL